MNSLTIHLLYAITIVRVNTDARPNQDDANDNKNIDKDKSGIHGPVQNHYLKTLTGFGPTKILRVVQTQAILILKSLSEWVGSDIERL